jgi:CO dehydrogenase/acetyl-CoA synthase delta subunit
MTATPAPALSDAEAATLARFEAAPEPEEITVERVARAIYGVAHPVADPWSVSWEDEGEWAQERYRRYATAAVAALAPQADDGTQGIWLR